MSTAIKILIVDDRDENLLVLENLLSDPALTIIKARSGKEALEKIQEHHFALALIDVVMPHMGGFETAEVMRSMEETRHLPIIFITATHELRSKTFKGYQSGAVDFLYKPIEPEILQLKVDAFKQIYLHQCTIEEKNTQLNNAKTLIEHKAQELELASRHKTEFLSNVSHEIRTPLNSVILLSQILERNEFNNLNEKQLDFIHTILESGRELLGLVDDILDLSKVESGKVDYKIESINLYQIAGHIKQNFEAQAQEKGLDLRINICNHLPSQITTDWDKLRQILNNLIVNAFKFTSSGYVEFEICSPSEDVEFHSSTLDSKHCISFSVRDTGKGISPRMTEAIFDPFTQEDSSDTRQHGGTGLGLAIVRRFAALLEGEVHVQSDQEKGSTFTLYLPEEISKQAQKSSKFSLESNPTNSHSVLLIDSNPEQAQELLKLLQKDSLNITWIHPGTDLPILEQSFQPDYVLVGIDESSTCQQFLNTHSEYLKNLKNKTLYYSSLEQSFLREMGLDKVVSIDNESDFSQLMYQFHLLLHPESLKPVEEKSPASSPLSSKNILLVDDDVRVIFPLVHLLETEGAHVTPAYSGKEALKLLEVQAHVDVIIMDIMMPEMNGIEAIQKIRNCEAFRDIPILALSAKAMKEDCKQYLEAGASAFLSKPVDGDQLIQVLSELTKSAS